MADTPKKDAVQDVLEEEITDEHREIGRGVLEKGVKRNLGDDAPYQALQPKYQDEGRPKQTERSN